MLTKIETSNFQFEIKSLREDLDCNEESNREYAVKRVLSLMRSGENVGELFSSMLRCVNTNNIQIKKLIYHYLVTYSSQEPEQSIMAVNTFIHDSEDPNPIIRALAVRTMCRIKLESVAEYMILPLKKCLKDSDPYVRKTAAIAVAKLYAIIPESIENSELLTILQQLLNDANPMVISNATAALFEVNENRKTPIFILNETTVTPLLSAMTQCSDWVQTILLDSLSKYNPLTTEEATFLIDRLITFLKHSNPAVVIGSFRCIYRFMAKDKREVTELFGQIIPPFITLVSSGEPEIQYVILRTLSLFVQKYPFSLQKDARIFFCHYNDPSYIKIEKLNIIVTIATVSNVKLVINELEEYCNDVDVAFVRKTIQSLGQIALKLPVSSRKIVDILVSLVESKAEYAVESAVEVFTMILRAFPGDFESVIEKVCQSIEIIKKSSSKSAAIWIIGEYCQLIQNADVLLDPFLDTFHDEDPIVQSQIITAVVKNYLVHPEQSKDQLQYLFEEATKENVLPDIRNRAFIYWRFLTLSHDYAREAVIFSKNDFLKHYCEDANSHHSNEVKCFDDNVLNELIKNIGNVSGVLHVLPSEFVQSQLFAPENENNYDELSDDNEPVSHEWQKVFIPQLPGDLNSIDSVDIFVDWDSSELWLKVVNKINQQVGSFALAFNKNCVGIEIAEFPKFPNQIDFGESFEVCVPLKYNEASRFPITDENNLSLLLLQIALKTSTGNKMFAIPIDFTCVTQHFDEIGVEQFESMWNQTPQETSFTVNKAVIANKPILTGRGICKIGNDDENSEENDKKGKNSEIVDDLLSLDAAFYGNNNNNNAGSGSGAAGGVRVAFCLPPSFIYLARLYQIGNSVNVVVHGNPALFAVVRNYGLKLFCVESNNL